MSRTAAENYIAERHAAIDATYSDVSAFCGRHGINADEFRNYLYRGEPAALLYLSRHGIEEDIPRKAPEPAPMATADAPPAAEEPEPSQSVQEPSQPRAKPDPWASVLAGLPPAHHGRA